MSGETVITVIGNLTADPELRFTPSGSAVANFSIASTPRVFDRDTNEWKDGETLFLRSSVWREPAENVVESLVKGTRVITQGVLKQRKYTPKEGGDERTVIEYEIQEIGPSLKYAKAVVTRVQQGQGQGGFGGGQQAQGGYAPQGQQQGGYAPQGGQQQGGWSQPAAQQAVAQQGGYAPQGAQGGYAQQGQPQGGGQYAGGTMAPQQAAQQDPWATPGVSNPGGGQWGNGPAQGQQQGAVGEPPF